MVQRATEIGNSENILVCSAPCTIHDTNDGAVCVRHADGCTVSLTTREAQLLRRMSSSRTISEWIEILRREDVGGKTTNGRRSRSTLLTEMLEMLSSFRQKTDRESTVKIYGPLHEKDALSIRKLMELDLLVAEGQALQAVRSSGTVSSACCRITRLCIPTCGRSDYLYRCVKSFSRSLRSHERSDASIIVVDDSNNRKLQSAKREMITSLSGGGSLAIHFVGDEERRKLIEDLVNMRVVPYDLIDFALRPEKQLMTAGATRNTIMLLTAGSCILQVDDDTSCAFVSVNQHNGVVKVSSRPDPYQTSFYGDREGNLKAFPLKLEIDPFAMHESLLGKSLACLANEGKSIAWEGVTPYTLTSLLAEDSRIDLTASGMSGDPGRRSSVGFLMLAPEDTLRRIYSTPDSYRLATHVREVMRSVPEFTISRGGCFQSMTLGVNNTRLMPPFFPLGRNEDGAFADLYLKSDEKSWIGHLPFAISHESEPNRSYDASAVESVCRPILADIIALCLSSASGTAGGNLSQCLRCVGEQFVAFGLLSPTAFRSLLRNQFIRRQLSVLSSIEERISTTAFRSVEWTSDMHSISNGIRHSILDDLNIVPADLAAICGPIEALEVTQSYVAKYGRLMLLWEDIYEAAKAICPIR